MSNEIDELMSMDPLDMTRTHIDGIIAFYRNRRAAPEGGKPKKEKGPGLKIDRELLGLTKPKGPAMLRRSLKP